mgnify:CR=1 FL=1
MNNCRNIRICLVGGVRVKNMRIGVVWIGGSKCVIGWEVRRNGAIISCVDRICYSFCIVNIVGNYSICVRINRTYISSIIIIISIFVSIISIVSIIISSIVVSIVVRCNDSIISVIISN